MKINKTIIIPLLILVFAAFGFEQLVLPYVSFGSGRWSDSIGTNVSNRKARINGDLNIIGNYYKNGVLFSGGSGTPIVVSNEGTEVESEMSSINFVGNTFTATSTSGDVTLTSNVDTNNYFSRYRLDTSNLAMLNEAASFAGDISGANVSTVGTLSAEDLNINDLADVWSLSVGSTATFIAGITLADATKVIVNSGNDILYKVSTSGAHIFQTQSGTDIARIDSSSGISAKIEGLSGIWGSEPMVKQKLIRGVTASAVNGTQTYAHNITNGRIIGMTATLRVDTSGVSGYGNDYTIFPFANTFMGTGYQWTAYFDSLNVGTKLGGSADAIKLDSVFFLLTYIIPG